MSVRNRVQILVAGALSVVLFVAVAQAQRGFVTAKRVDITILGGCGDRFKRVLVVRNGDEEVSRQAKHQGADQWTVDMKVDPDLDTFSLRLGGARTGCQKGERGRDRDNRDLDIALVSFNCNGNEEPVRQVLIYMPQNVGARYERDLIDGNDHCPSFEILKGTKSTVADLRVAGEAFRLQLGWKELDPRKPPEEPGLLLLSPDVKSSGLPLFSPDRKHPDMLVFNPELQGYMGKIKMIDNTLSLTSNDVADALVRQGSLTGRIPVRENLRARLKGLETITLTVQ